MALRPSVKGLIFLIAFVSLAMVAFGQDHGEAAGAVVAAAGYNKAFAVGIACACVAIGVGLVGYSAASAVGRNPGAAGEVLKIGIIAMAFVEAIAFYVMFLAGL